jgi:hypothetical protein
MTLDQIKAWRRWAGRIGSFLCILLFLIIIDDLVARFREPLNLFSGLPGDRLAVSGPLTKKTNQVSELIGQTDSSEIQLELKSIQKGFWLGGYLWNGSLNISPTTLPGEYHLTVRPKDTPAEKSSPLYRIHVYKDLRELKRNSKSFLVRSLGIYPWQAGLFLLFPILFTFAFVFYLSHMEERLLAEQGKAEIYRVRKKDLGYEISFGLGSKQGIQTGSNLILIDHQGKILGSIIVAAVYENHSTALVDPGLPVRPGFIISRP